MGLTGAVGAGKTTVLEMFAGLGAQTVSADTLVHALYTRPEIKWGLAARFGSGILDREGQVCRRALARIVLGDETEMSWLEAFVHPHVLGEIRQQIETAKTGSVVVCEIPLLVDLGLVDEFDLVVTIEASPETRAERRRDTIGEQEFRAIDQRQLDPQDRIAASDMVYVNDGSRTELEAFVREVYRRAQEIALAKVRQAKAPDWNAG